MEEEEEIIQNKYYSDEIKWVVVISIKYFNLTYDQISEKFQIANKGTISKIYNKYLVQNNVENNHHLKGRNYTINDQMEECVSQSFNKLKQMPFSSENIMKTLSDDRQMKISQSLIIKCLKILGLKYGKVKYIHQLSQQNKDDRIKHIQEMLKYDYERIIFSVESLFQLDENGLQIWHSENENIVQRKVLSYKNRSMMIWGTICTSGKSEFYIHETSVDSTAYVDCLQESLIPMSKALFGRKKFYLLQDGARSHTSKLTKDWITKQKLLIIQNSPYSPDINPIELIWASMKRSIIKNSEELKSIILMIWNEISQEVIDNCVKHAQNQLELIIQNNGNILN